MVDGVSDGIFCGNAILFTLYNFVGPITTEDRGWCDDSVVIVVVGSFNSDDDDSGRGNAIVVTLYDLIVSTSTPKTLKLVFNHLNLSCDVSNDFLKLI